MTKYLVPIAIFVLIGVLLGYGLSLDPKRIPSPLIGKPLTTFKLATVADPDRQIATEDLRGQVFLLNVWASWCVACRQEHPLLMEISRRNLVKLIGLNYKDERDNAQGLLAGMGNPYSMSLMDTDGRVGIDLGVYGVPETFLIDKQGIIRYKQIGPISEKVWTETLMPLVEKYS